MHLVGTIESVPPAKIAAACRFLAGGLHPDLVGEIRAEAFEQIVRGSRGSRLWWFRRLGRLRASALVASSEGGTGMVFYSPPHAPGVDVRSLEDLLRALSEHAIKVDGLTLVQALIRTESELDRRVLAQAGFHRLAELIYMTLSLPAPLPPQPPAGLELQRFGEYDEDELGELILATYQESRDCPDLAGLRDVRDTIAGHRTSGTFRPEWWWMARCQGRPAGCLLMNSSSAEAAEVVYLGVAAEFRRRGIARGLLAEAIRAAEAEPVSTMTLAVDADNLWAKRLYRASGFHETHRRLAYVRTRRDVE